MENFPTISIRVVQGLKCKLASSSLRYPGSGDDIKQIVENQSVITLR